MRTWQETKEWYQTHQTTAEIGFNPDGMCLAVCRTARQAPYGAPSAVVAQKDTPAKYRVHRIRDLRTGMVIYVDDPHDSNKFGHIVTMVGRRKNFQWDDPNDVLVRTNSVVSGKLVVVPLTYFKQHWGDDYQFGAFYLNGAELDYPGWRRDGKGKEVKPKPKPEPKPDPNWVTRFRKTAGNWDVNILDKVARADVKPKIKAIEAAVKGLPDDPSDNSRVAKFKEKFKKDRILDMSLINDAVDDGRVGSVKSGRDKIRAALKSVLRS